MDYYKTLGLQRGASDADIKKAYRSLAMKHHPDRGGDETKFKELSTAYDVLSDPQKKSVVDMGGDPNGHNPGFGGFGGFDNGPFEFHFGNGFGGFQFRSHNVPRNQSFSINVTMTLEEVLSGKDINAEVNSPAGKKKMINISVPAGIESGQQVRYQGMGDDSVAGAPPGDLLVNVTVLPHRTFRREGNAIVVDRTISVWDAILGTTVELQTLNGRTITISIPAGTQPETVLSCSGEGLPTMHNAARGNLLLRIKIVIPKGLDESQIEKLQAIRAGF